MAVLPRSSFIHTVHHGKRRLKEADKFIYKVKQKSNAKAPLFLSDAWFYEEVLEKNYCSYRPRPYQGRGRPPLPERVVDPQLKYAQVFKERDAKGKLIKVHTRIIRGSESEILEIIANTSRAKRINTSYVESRNQKYRKDNARLNRKTMCHSKKPQYHDAHIDWLTAVFNFCRENPDLKELINPNAARFEPKYARKSPAMKEGFTTKILTVKELLAWRTPIN